ncbi:carcinoembryonic antigen-related cell adhesion molecule 2-like isoform X2 [Clupea harengus]|uniref:Carcinoembryonic antigen-related cell adhesion molecule 2-like isoform X2 n=1 Tax=Clupea harengus TaxID=7950 RepID=A0A6P8F8E6_CLUHA|nr:carcinoembryonic antigen-related cell adhesion molecule 2-like isoform X2 [Clupea harengus]
MTSFLLSHCLHHLGMFQVETICSVRRETPCYRTLGHTVHLQLTTSTSGYALNLDHNDQRIFRFRKSQVTFLKDSVKDRWQFSPENGTLRIGPAERNDSGLYKAESFDQSTGKSIGGSTVQLTIEAPVDKPVLTQHCSDWIRAVNCSSNGDSPQYIWSLNGRPLSEADADLRADNQTLRLSRNVTGELTCSVSNHVSSNKNSVLLHPCHDTQTVATTHRTDSVTNTTTPSRSVADVIIVDVEEHWWIYYVIIPVSLGLLISLAVTICVCRKKKTHRTVNGTNMWSSNQTEDN